MFLRSPRPMGVVGQVGAVTLDLVGLANVCGGSGRVASGRPRSSSANVCGRSGQSRHVGHWVRIGSEPFQSTAAARIASKTRSRVADASAISITVPGWPS